MYAQIFLFVSTSLTRPNQNRARDDVHEDKMIWTFENIENTKTESEAKLPVFKYG
jgi:hypothetical protein